MKSSNEFISGKKNTRSIFRKTAFPKRERKDNLKKANVIGVLRRGNLLTLFDQNDSFRSFNDDTLKSENTTLISYLQSKLLEVKAQHDNIAEEMRERENEVRHMETQIKEWLLKEEDFRLQDKILTQEEMTLSSELSSLDQELRQAESRQTSYQFMLGRLKTDEQVAKERGFSLDNEYSKKDNLLHYKRETLIKKNEEYKITQAALKQLEDTMKTKQQERKQFIKKLKFILKEKEQIATKDEAINEGWDQEIINSTVNFPRRTIVDKQNQKWQSLFFIHKFVAFFLTWKMNKDIAKYSNAESSFKKIRSGTVLF